MNELLLQAAGAVIAAIVINLLGLNRSILRIESEERRQVSWLWKVLVLGGGFLFWYGLFIFVANLAVEGLGNLHTGLGISLFMFGILFWLIGRLVIYFKR